MNKTTTSKTTPHDLDNFSCEICDGSCECGLGALVTARISEIAQGSARILSIIQPMEGDSGNHLISHSIVKKDQMVIEQYFGSELITTFGPFSEKFAAVFDQILASMEERAATQFPAKKD